MKTIIIAAILLLANPGHATTLHFNIFFQHTTPLGFTGIFPGTYTLTDGKLTQFDAVLTFACVGPFLCDFHNIIGPGDPSMDIVSILTDTYSFAGVDTNR